jgi:hypothetical protein
MKYVLLFVGTMEEQEKWDAQTREEALASYAKAGEWFMKYGRSGKLVGGEELQGPATATTISRKDGKVTVTDGPFIESKEVIGGFAVIDVADLDEALAMAKEWPGGPVEVRPVVDHSEDQARAEET